MAMPAQTLEKPVRVRTRKAPAGGNETVMRQEHGRDWSMYCGDSCEILPTLPTASVHFSVFSPPFSSLYTYTPSERDLGNVRNRDEFFEHFAFITKELVRLMIPGRIVVMHTGEIQLYENREGYRGRYDFPGACERHMQEAGFARKGKITINKNPQTQAIRNHPQELLFATMRKDRADLCPAQADYLLVFQAPGDNPIPIVAQKGDDGWVTEEEWIRWAHPVWNDIRETNILDLAGSKGHDDERHLCPLQLDVIERCVRLWSNPVEVVLSPFAGIGSELYQSVKCGRKGLGVELKPSYFDCAVRNLKKAEIETKPMDLFAEE